jgi:hypothetical protein
MFILYAVIIGLLVGLAVGGRPAGLAELRFRWPWIFMTGLAVQLVLFSDAVTERIGESGMPIYVASTLVVLVAVLGNWRIPGMLVVALGALSNLVAIVANGGYMPASTDAMAALGKVPKTVYSNSVVVPDPALAPLTDIFALPTWLPFANVFSAGDVLIGIGVVLVLALTMRRPASMAVGAA